MLQRIRSVSDVQYELLIIKVNSEDSSIVIVSVRVFCPALITLWMCTYRAAEVVRTARCSLTSLQRSRRTGIHESTTPTTAVSGSAAIITVVYLATRTRRDRVD